MGECACLLVPTALKLIHDVLSEDLKQSKSAVLVCRPVAASVSQLMNSTRAAAPVRATLFSTERGDLFQLNNIPDQRPVRPVKSPLKSFLTPVGTLPF